MLLEEFSASTRHIVDTAAVAGAVVAGVSFWQGVALTVTIIAGLMSISLGLLRWYEFSVKSRVERYSTTDD